MINANLSINDYIKYIKDIGKASKQRDISKLSDSLIKISNELFAGKALFKNNNFNTKTQIRVTLNLLKQIIIFDMMIKYTPEVAFEELRKNHLTRLIS